LAVQSPAELEKGKNKKKVIRNRERMTVTHLSSTCVVQFYNRDWAAFTFTMLPFFERIHSGHKLSTLCHMTQILKHFYGFICPTLFSGNTQITSGDTIT
jgi:hypothetical protein